MKNNYGLPSVANIDYLYSATVNRQSQLDSQANNALSRGIDFYTKKNYTEAAREFKHSLALSPYSNYSTQAYDYLAQAYLQQNKPAQAIATYQQAIKANPYEDTFHLKLGDIYYKTDKTKEAQAEYEQAVKLNPQSADNRYSLGLIYLNTGQLDKAKAQFRQVTQVAPNSVTGYLGLGQVERQSKKYNEAINQLNHALRVDKSFSKAYLELGYTYTDMGNTAMAQEQVASLKSLNSSGDLILLESYITRTTPPKIQLGYSPDGFDTTLGPGTLVSQLDSTLTSAGATKSFSMTFLFSKEMDVSSIQSLPNWEITRQAGGSISDDYNFGQSVPSTEVSLSSIPTNVVYNSEEHTATVTFQITQNETVSGTIDPSHILFKFNGVDIYKKRMDPKADEFTGFSLIA